jgi:hypothetical protein
MAALWKQISWRQLPLLAETALSVGRRLPQRMAVVYARALVNEDGGQGRGRVLPKSNRRSGLVGPLTVRLR